MAEHPPKPVPVREVPLRDPGFAEQELRRLIRHYEGHGPHGASSVHGFKRIPVGTSVISGSVKTIQHGNIFDDSEFDTDGYRNGFNEFVVPEGLGGLYYVRFGVSWEANADGSRQLFISQPTPTAEFRGSEERTEPVSNGQATSHTCTAITKIDAGTAFHVQAFQDSGTTLDISNNQSVTYTSAYLIGTLA